MSNQNSMQMMGGGKDGREPSIPSKSGELWYIICIKGKVRIVKERNKNDGKELYPPFETKKEATEWANHNYPDEKC